VYRTAKRAGEGRGNAYIRRAYTARCTCSNAKVISPVTCRSSVKYLMNPRPRGGVFIDVIPGERVPSARFFATSLPPPSSRARRFRPSIKSHSKRPCYDIEDEEKRRDAGEAGEIRERSDREPKSVIKDAARVVSKSENGTR